MLIPAELLATLKVRFEKHPNRHLDIAWSDVQAKLESNLDKLKTLAIMEETGGEPDVVAYDPETGEFLFFDCSPESPNGRRSLCYDQAAWESRKEHKPKGNAMTAAADMGIVILTEEQYAHLQSLGEFDTKTSSWLLTPDSIRKLGGAIFGDRRFDHIFTYHNGAESYYASRGFRGCLRV